ncbi:MAG: response regulator [Alphaproteobacteria bacterium]|jgi:CheY-like chemotaxis protein|nr:response regulator [Alphaproteobacteria bacterium]MDP6563337.1 response regulator [Alphaproteobacteria bacterium]
MSQILIIDDDSGYRVVLRDLLEDSGHQVTEAEDGARGIDLLKAKEAAFDLIITDVVMPGDSGIEVIKESRNHCPSAKLLAISGGSEDLPARWSLKMTEMFGVDAALFKPFGNEEFLDLVDTLLSDADAG